MPATFSHDPDNRLFIVEQDGHQGTVSYQQAGPGVLDFQSTYIPHVLRNRHLGTRLVHYALDWARQNNQRVIPSCWFVRVAMENDKTYGALRAEG